MKKYASLAAAGLLVLVSSAVTLIHAARNRSGPPTAVITLSSDELVFTRDTDDSGILLQLQISHLYHDPYAPAWLPPAGIAALGFDTSVHPDDTRALDHYRRQCARRAFVAFEVGGPAYQRALAAVNEPRRQGITANRSRLFPVDASLNAQQLHARYAGRAGVLILPAVVRVLPETSWSATATRAARPARLNLAVIEVPSQIHVPLPFSQSFRVLPVTARPENSPQPLYHVTLRYGRFYEPQITAVSVP